jgi:chromosome partitioning protein
VKRIAVANQKGGVGKTTVALNLAAELDDLGFRVLAIDLDRQCNLTSGLGINVPPERTVYQLLIDGARPEQVITRLDRGARGFDVIPGSPSLNVAEALLMTETLRETRLAECLEPLAGKYDFILFDCAPSLGVITMNAIVAADWVLVPVETNQWAYDAIRDVHQMVSKLQKINPRVKITDIVPTVYDRRVGHHNAVLEALRELGQTWPGGVAVHEPIAYSARVVEASSKRVPLRDYDRGSAAADAFERLAGRLAQAAQEAPA